jgi:serine O-acetyltransferase
LERPFLQSILTRHQTTTPVPSTHAIAAWADRLLELLYPERSKECFHDISQIHFEFEQLELDLRGMLLTMQSMLVASPVGLAESIMGRVPEIYRKLNTDVDAIMKGDPAATSNYEIIRSYPGFYAIAFYRIAHEFYLLDIPLLPRILTEHAHALSGSDIHPAAAIDEYFYIDHATGIVIGSTAIIGKHVKIYQGVTLGALSVSKDMAHIKRHPTIEDNVVIYANATILGGKTIIGSNSIIGGNVWLTKSLPAYSMIYHKPETTISQVETK